MGDLRAAVPRSTRRGERGDGGVAVVLEGGRRAGVLLRVEGEGERRGDARLLAGERAGAQAEVAHGLARGAPTRARAEAEAPRGLRRPSRHGEAAQPRGAVEEQREAGRAAAARAAAVADDDGHEAGAELERDLAREILLVQQLRAVEHAQHGGGARAQPQPQPAEARAELAQPARVPVPPPAQLAVAEAHPLALLVEAQAEGRLEDAGAEAREATGSANLLALPRAAQRRGRRRGGGAVGRALGVEAGRGGELDLAAAQARRAARERAVVSTRLRSSLVRPRLRVRLRARLRVGGYGWGSGWAVGVGDGGGAEG